MCSLREINIPSCRFTPFLSGKTGRLHALRVYPRSGFLQPAHKGTGLSCRAEQQAEESSPDFIERMVGALFGKKALETAEPFGMKRMSEEAYNEQSVATTTELAAPVEGDSPEVALLRPLLAKTRLQSKPLRSALHPAFQLLSLSYYWLGTSC